MTANIASITSAEVACLTQCGSLRVLPSSGSIAAMCIIQLDHLPHSCFSLLGMACHHPQVLRPETRVHRSKRGQLPNGVATLAGMAKMSTTNKNQAARPPRCEEHEGSPAAVVNAMTHGSRGALQTSSSCQLRLTHPWLQLLCADLVGTDHGSLPP